MIIITEIYNDNYTLEDVMTYLGLDSIYKGIDDPNSDFLERLVVETDEDELQDILKKKNKCENSQKV